jgi:hypothetical protein
MSKYDFIYVNGDSYSAENSGSKCYSDFLHDKLNIPVFNKASAGGNNYRITRIALENILEMKSQHPSMLAILGMSFITRDEIWYDDIEQSQVIPDRAEFPQSRLATSRVLDNGPWDKIKDRIVDLNINRQLVHFYTNLYMLTQTLENFGIDYFIFSAARNDGWREANWSFINSLQIVKECNSNPKIFNLHDFSIPVFAEQNNIKTTNTGHLFENGHDKFSDFLIKQLKLL